MEILREFLKRRNIMMVEDPKKEESDVFQNEIQLGHAGDKESWEPEPLLSMHAVQTIFLGETFADTRRDLIDSSYEGNPLMEESNFENHEDSNKVSISENAVDVKDVQQLDQKTESEGIRVVLSPLPLRKKGHGPQKLDKPVLEIKRYKVLYSNFNTRKNKIWEKDGILHVQGQSFTLYKGNSKYIETVIPLFTSVPPEKIKYDLEFYLGRIEIKIQELLTEEQSI